MNGYSNLRALVLVLACLSLAPSGADATDTDIQPKAADGAQGQPGQQGGAGASGNPATADGDGTATAKGGDGGTGGRGGAAVGAGTRSGNGSIAGDGGSATATANGKALAYAKATGGRGGNGGSAGFFNPPSGQLQGNTQNGGKGGSAEATITQSGTAKAEGGAGGDVGNGVNFADKLGGEGGFAKATATTNLADTNVIADATGGDGGRNPALLGSPITGFGGNAQASATAQGVGSTASAYAVGGRGLDNSHFRDGSGTQTNVSAIATTTNGRSATADAFSSAKNVSTNAVANSTSLTGDTKAIAISHNLGATLSGSVMATATSAASKGEAVSEATATAAKESAATAAATANGLKATPKVEASASGAGATKVAKISAGANVKSSAASLGYAAVALPLPAQSDFTSAEFGGSVSTSSAFAGGFVIGEPAQQDVSSFVPSNSKIAAYLSQGAKVLGLGGLSVASEFDSGDSSTFSESAVFTIDGAALSAGTTFKAGIFGTLIYGLPDTVSLTVSVASDSGSLVKSLDWNRAQNTPYQLLEWFGDNLLDLGDLAATPSFGSDVLVSFDLAVTSTEGIVFAPDFLVAIPEPHTWMLVFLGLLLLAMGRGGARICPGRAKMHCPGSIRVR